MIFNTDYWNSLKRKEREEVMLNPANIGYSLGVGPALDNLKSGIFTGANTVELGFMSAPGKGQNKDSPEMWGKSERQEMKELARVNEVDVSVHASPNMGSGGAALSGFDGQQRKFSDAARKKAIDEIQRTAEFAADVAGGGPVVVHLDGFPREIFRADAEKKFEEYPYEEHKAPVYFVDKTNGDIFPVSRETKVPMPVIDKKTGKYVPDEETGAFKIELKTFKEVEEDYYKNKEELNKKDINSPYSHFYNEANKSTMEEARARRQDFVGEVQKIGSIQDILQEKIKAYDEIKRLQNPTAAKKIFMRELINNGLMKDEILNASDEEQQKIFDNPKNYLQ